MTTNDENIKPSEQSGEGTTPPPVENSAGAGSASTEPSDAERELRDKLLRAVADLDNARKRHRRELEEARQRGKDDAIKEILPVFDNLERAVAAAESTQTIDSVVEGVKMVLKLFEDTAERMGMTRVKTVGERFDPAVHEAIQQQETDAHPPGSILAEVVPGYVMGQRLLRAAMVVVARKPAAKPADSNEQAPGGNAPAAGEVSRPESGAADGGHNG